MGLSQDVVQQCGLTTAQEPRDHLKEEEGGGL